MAKVEPIDATAFFKSQDLAALQLQLQELEGNLELLIREKHKEIDALRLLVKTVDVFQNGKPVVERKPKQPKPDRSAAPQQTIVERAITYLRAAGPSTAAAIAHGIQCQSPSVYNALNSDSRFRKIDGGKYALA